MPAREPPGRTAAPAALPEGERHGFGSYETLLLRQPGAAHLVIALSGVGDVSRPLSGFDFHNSLPLIAGVDTLLLRDQARSWWQAPEGRAALEAYCRTVAQARAYRSVTLLGVSMGAFGALQIGAVLPQARVVALGPPWSADIRRHGRFVVRYKDWLDAAGDGAGAGSDARLVGDPARYLLLFGDEEPIDLANADLFRRADWPGLFMLPGGQHNLGAELKRRGALDRVLRLLALGAPLPAIAGAAGALPVHAHAHGVAMLRARDSLYRGALAAADAWLDDARAAVGEASGPLNRLLWLRRGLDQDLGRLSLLPRAGLARHRLVLPDGARLELESSFASGPEKGLPVLLGPLVLARLRWPGVARAELRLQAAAPPRPNAGASLALAGFVPQGAGWQVQEVAQEPADMLRLALALEQGETRFLLRRRCFSSGFDALRTEDQQSWAMRLQQLALEAAPG
ncbi:hypothetical protein [Pseudoroseomonas cervicalis]|uniref:hypothetical protein n=1 Tax=Teichococcus cervicalis TaxID=204525 RepID=UPI0022F16537|nr:hypothetical protein [Pseudoroseomonas cervicalis]WBV45094.1 hypothetical protein PFY06_19840 [Pseudoroseomonas cervicalis]